METTRGNAAGFELVRLAVVGPHGFATRRALLAGLPAAWDRQLPGALAYRPLFLLPLLGSVIGLVLGYLMAVGVLKVAQGPISQFMNITLGLPVVSPVLVLVAILLAGAACSSDNEPQSATLVVNSLEDTATPAAGVTTLRSAIAQAAPGDVITFDHEKMTLRVPTKKAKAAGLWAPQSPREFGGMQLPIVAWAAIYEEAARSIFGPLAIHCMAPDDGNMNLLARAGTKVQKDKWLKPIVDGKVRSAFAMTEPHPGSGSDPGMMLTRAEKKGDRYIIRGRKWFITGADGASHFILIARTSDEPRRGLTAFLYHKDQPGWRILDLCAAPGGKTIQMAEVTGDRACIVATDVDEARLEKLRSAVEAGTYETPAAKVSVPDSAV